ncbi:hypothetical protein Tco_0589117 [Tanacetum coccineum]
MNQKRSHSQVTDCIKSSIRLKLLSCTFKKSKDALMFKRLWNLPDSIFRTLWHVTCVLVVVQALLEVNVSLVTHTKLLKKKLLIIKLLQVKLLQRKREELPLPKKKKKGRTLAVTAEDMQKRKNDVKARTTLLLALPDEHQLRFSKYETTKELWEAILKIFGGNEATKKTKKNQLKQQYGNFKAEGSETLEQTFNRLNDLDEMSLDDLYNHLKVYEPEIQKKTGSSSHNMAFISSPSTNSGKGEVSTAIVQTASSHVTTANPEVTTVSFSHDTICAYITTQSNGSQIKYEDITQIDDDDIEEMDIKWNMALLSMRADRAPRSQDKGRRESYKKEPNVEEPAEEEEAPTEFDLMAKSSSSSDNEVYDDSFCSKSCRKNTESLNTKINKLNEELSNSESDLFNYKRGLSQVEARLVEFKVNETKFCERIRVLKRDVEIKDNKIESLNNELEALKKEKEGIDFKIKGFSNASKDLDDLLGNSRQGKDKTGLPEFADDTLTDYTRPTPSVDVLNGISSKQEGNNSSVFE